MNSDKFAELQAQILQLNINEKEKSNLLTTLGDLKHTKILRNPQYIIEDTVKLNKVTTIEKYDIISSIVMGIAHPCLVYKVNKETNIAYALCFTTNENFVGNIFTLENSRFFKNNFATCTLLAIPVKDAIKQFKCVIDNKSEADRIFNAAKRFYKNLFKI